jgi:hypothetical protein
MPPKAITSSVFLGLEDGAGGERCDVAIHGASETIGFSFFCLVSEDAASFGLQNPSSRVLGEKEAVSFAALRGGDGVFCP